MVSIIGTLSNPRPVVSEVPKWSGLGLVLFQLYVNDITDNISSHMRLFADDVVIYRESNTQKDHLALQQDLDNWCKWAHLWQLSFLITKCYHLRITSKTVPFCHDYLMNDQTTSTVTSTKYLGITLNQKLNWNQHCDLICSNANGTLGLLRRVLGDCTTDVKSKAYVTLVRPQLEYASSAWNPYTNVISTRLKWFNIGQLDLCYMIILD